MPQELCEREESFEQAGRVPETVDRRTVRSRAALREALTEEIRATGDLSRVTATALATRAGLTRRSFYTHYRDVNDLVAQVEEEALVELDEKIAHMAAATLADMSQALDKLEPVPGSVELLEYIRENGIFYQALLGEGGDPAFVEKIKSHVREVIAPRALTGIAAPAVGAYFAYYLTFAISAEMGVLMRWLAGGMVESSEVMARIMTSLMFVRPGDLYGSPVSIDIPRYGLALAGMSLSGIVSADADGSRAGEGGQDG